MLSDTKIWIRLKALGIEKWIAEKKASGQIQNIGFSFHGATHEFCSVADLYPWDFCQIQLNYMDESSQAGVAGLKYAAGKGLAVIIMEPLRGGRLANLPKDAARILPEGKTAADLGLRWLWDFPEVTCVLSGMNDAMQIEENLASAARAKAGGFSAEERGVIADIRAVLEKNIQVHCTGCGYCMPCPRGVAIPTCFAAYNQAFLDGKIAALFTYIKATSIGKQQGTASQCVKCGLCEKMCPQHILIRDELEDAAAVLEGPLYKIGLCGARFVLRMKK